MDKYESALGATAPGRRRPATRGGAHQRTMAILATTGLLWIFALGNGLSCTSATRHTHRGEPSAHPSHAQAREPAPGRHEAAPKRTVHSNSQSISVADAVAKGREELVRREVDPERYRVSARRTPRGWSLTFTPKPPVNRTLKIFVQVGLRGNVLGFRRNE